MYGWEDFGRPVYEAQKLIRRQRRSWNQEGGIEMEHMDPLRAELNFLYTFVCYSNLRSSDAAQEFKKYVKRDFLQKFNVHPFQFKTSDLLDVLIILKEQMSVLKEEIRASYDGSLSTLSFQPQKTLSWSHFYSSLQSNLRHLSRSEKKSEKKSEENPEKKLSDEDNPLKQQMKTLLSNMSSLEWLITSCYNSRSPWVEMMRAHFGGMFVQVAHLCCFYWSNSSPNSAVLDESSKKDVALADSAVLDESWKKDVALADSAVLDESWKKDVALALSDLWCKMDPETPEFLDIALGFLRQCDEKYSQVSASSFLHYVFDSADKRSILHEQLVILLSYFVRVPEVFDMDEQKILEGIEYVIKEARYLKGGEKTDLAILFAKIWHLKAEIFIRSSGSVLIYSKQAIVQALYDGSKFLEETPTPTNQTSTESEIVHFVEGVLKQVQSLYQSPPDESCFVHHKASNLLLKSSVHVMLLKAKALLLRLLEDDSMAPPLKHQIGFLHEGLFFLLQSDIFQPNEVTAEEKLILIAMEVVATGVISVYKKAQAEKDKEDAKFQLAGLLEKVQQLKAHLKDLYLQVPAFVLPKTPGFFFIQFLLLKLRDLLLRKPDSIAHTTYQIDIVRVDLEGAVSEFQDVLEHNNEKSEHEDLHTKIVDVAYQVEHVIDSILGGNEVVWQHILLLYHLSEQIRGIKLQLRDNKIHDDDKVSGVPRSLEPDVPQVVTAPVDEVITVGSSQQKDKIIDQLTRGTQKLQYVSIVGMPGIGKTTLANNVFCSKRIRCHFPVRAWCCVSQNYSERDLLLSILSHIIDITEDTLALSNADLHALLRRKLKDRRYLIVMDDVWSTKALGIFKLSFSDDSKQSRILLTSRIPNEFSKIGSVLHSLEPLTPEESWDLLKSKIFGKDKWPDDLLDVGEQIAKNCKGLPLAIGAIAGLLAKTRGNRLHLWKQIAKRVSSLIVNDPETHCKNLLELSYNHLPNHLKACLLYFGAFPEDKDISVQRLQWLWISEGFVFDSGQKSLEDLAEDYLKDLIGRSLVIVGKRRSTGEVKTCRVHDVVRDLCLLKAKEDRFMQQISAKDELYSSFENSDFGALYESFKPSDAIKYDQYRLYFCVDREQFVVSRPSGPFVRSIIVTATSDTVSRCSHDVSFIPANFKRLRVLDMESINMGNSFGIGIELLVDLSYFVVCGDMESIPPSLSQLRNLVTLFVKSLKRKVVLPDTIWSMKKLRHVHVSNHAIFTLPTDKKERSLQLDNLVTLSLPYFLMGEETNEIILKFPNLQKLKCVYSTPKHSSVNSQWFPALESLSHLESLNISYYGKDLITGKLCLPPCLKKLTLSKFHLSRQHMTDIGTLEKLEVLKLISCALKGTGWEMTDIPGLKEEETISPDMVESQGAIWDVTEREEASPDMKERKGPIWDMTEGEFCELQYLELDSLNIVDWEADETSLPKLKQLVLRNCEDLIAVPLDLSRISTWARIEVQQCRDSVTESITEIVKTELQDKLEIVINNLRSF